MSEDSKARTRCPRCDDIAVRLETKAPGTGGASREQAIQPRGGELAPGPLFFCRTHGAFSQAGNGHPAETKAERRARLAEALREVLVEVEGR